MDEDIHAEIAEEVKASLRELSVFGFTDFYLLVFLFIENMTGFLFTASLELNNRPFLCVF